VRQVALGVSVIGPSAMASQPRRWYYGCPNSMPLRDAGLLWRERL